jgi:hypothetical protein
MSAAAARPITLNEKEDIMKTPRRFQSRLLIRPSYKPERHRPRALKVVFRPLQHFDVPILERPALNLEPLTTQLHNELSP